MFYTIYKTTNLINGKYYVGMHKTQNLNDGYMGSGKLLKQAIKKYGINSFSKEILFIFDNEQDMIDKEYELVSLHENSYNLCFGGKGGFGYINDNNISKFKNRKHSDETKQKISKSRQYIKCSPCSEETKLKISIALRKKHQIDPNFTGRKKEKVVKISENSKPKLECPHCNKMIAINMLNRWHMNNCKMRM